MRSLLILGGLIICVLLVTPSNGDRTEDGGREVEATDSQTRRVNTRKKCNTNRKPAKCKPYSGRRTPIGRSFDGTPVRAEDQDGIVDVSEFRGHTEDGGANGIAAGSPSGPDQKGLARLRRQEPKDTSKPIRRKPCRSCYTFLSVPQEPTDTSKRQKPCRGCYTPLSFPDSDSKTRRIRKDVDRHGKPGRKEGSREKKRNGRKRQKDDKEGKISHRFGAHSPINASPPERKRKENPRDRMHKEEGKKRGRHHHRHEGKREEKIKWRSGVYTPVGSSPYWSKQEKIDNAMPDA